MERILIITNRLLGDGLDTFPALEFLFRHLFLQKNNGKERQFDLLAYRYTVSLYQKFPFRQIFLIDQQINYIDQNHETLFKSAKRLYHLYRSLKRQYTAVIIFPGGFGWGIGSKLLRPKYIIGHNNDYRGFFLTHPTTYSKAKTNYENFLAIAEKAVSIFTPIQISPLLEGGENPEMIKIQIALPKLIPGVSQLNNLWKKNLIHKISEYIGDNKKNYNVSIFKHYLVISPIASEENKMWEGERFLQIAKTLKGHGYAIFWLGLDKERPLIEKITGGFGYNIAGLLKISEVFSFIKGSQGFIGNDSGLAHAATMLGITTVVIYGPANPTLSRPLNGLIKKEDKENNKNKSNLNKLYQIYHEFPKIPHEQRKEKKFQEILDINKITVKEVWDKIKLLFPSKKKTSKY